MFTLTIETSGRAYDILYWHDLTAKEQREFDYLDTEDSQSHASFVRYRNWVYDLGEFMRAPVDVGMDAWDGYRGDSYFSGIVVKYTDDNERVLMGTYFS